MARGLTKPRERSRPRPEIHPLAWAFTLERVTGIEPALSAWESDRSGPLTGLTWTSDAPLVTAMNPVIPGLMARQWPSARGRCGLWPDAVTARVFVVVCSAFLS